MKKVTLYFSVLGALSLTACTPEDGSDGAPGDRGAPGAMGAPGTMGNVGATGPSGPTGPMGNPGDDGDPGVDARAYDFRRDAPAAYTRVDRMGMPAVATALVIDKNAYNDANPNDDVSVDTGSGLPRFVPSDIGPSLVVLHSALRDDLSGLGLTACSTGPAMTPDILPCATQTVGPGGPSVLSLIVPDTVTVDPSAPAGFPNGRRLADPVMDVTLAIILLNLTQHPATLFASLPLNPPANDLAFSSRFPYLAYPHVD